jgi:hypothetical protein
MFWLQDFTGAWMPFVGIKEAIYDDFMINKNVLVRKICLDPDSETAWSGSGKMPRSLSVSDPDPTLTSFFSDFKDAKFFYIFFFKTHPQAHAKI